MTAIDWDACPVCGEDNIDATDGTAELGLYTQRVACLECKAVWFETYQAVSREVHP